MDRVKKYIRELRKGQPNMHRNDFKFILERRKEQFDINETQMEEYLKYYNGKEYVDIMEDYYNNYLKKPFIDKLPIDVQKKIRDIYIGILPTYKVNASAIKSPDGIPIIILHSQLLTMVTHYNEMQMIFGRLMQNGYEEDAIRLLQDITKEICKCFIYHEYFPTMSLLPTMLDKDEFLFANSKSDIQILFIIAHELAHIYLGHLDDTSCEEIYIEDQKIKIEDYVLNQKYELEADVLAAQWIIDVLSKSDKASHINWDIFKNNSYLSFEIFMLFHLIEINSSRYEVSSGDISMEMSFELYCSRILDVVKELDDLTSSNIISDNSNHPKAILRMLNIIANNIEKFDETGNHFLMGMLKNALYYETFKYDSIIE